MKKSLSILILSSLFCARLQAQTDSSKGTFFHPIPRNYQVKQAVEVESLFPMFFYGGYHYALGYRYKKFRIRASVINGGTYNVEPAGIHNQSAAFKRYYKTSPGIFFGYNVWQNLELYTYVESHTFGILQKSTALQKNIHSTDFGAGIAYQFFFGRYVYLQPGLHLYLRKSNSLDFNSTRYTIPTADLSPVIRLGVRLWKQY